MQRRVDRSAHGVKIQRVLLELSKTRLVFTRDVVLGNAQGLAHGAAVKPTEPFLVPYCPGNCRGSRMQGR